MPSISPAVNLSGVSDLPVGSLIVAEVILNLSKLAKVLSVSIKSYIEFMNKIEN
jgi:hypothetical protein